MSALSFMSPDQISKLKMLEGRQVGVPLREVVGVWEAQRHESPGVDAPVTTSRLPQTQPD